MTFNQLIVSLCMFMAAMIGAAAREARADAWPPTPDGKNKTTQSADGRAIERYVHGARQEWGYTNAKPGAWDYHPAQETGPKEQNHNSFYVVSPKQPLAQAPLCVVLHSANRTAYDYLGFASLGRKLENSDDPATVMTRSPDDFYALYLNSTNDEWWGWSQIIRSTGSQARAGAPPTERRVLDTIEWVVNHYNIDRNRIYLCGVSMGGCGTLGIGLPNGDIFAAVLATVPAGTGYAACRMGGFAPAPAADALPAEREAWLRTVAGAGLADPPVMVDFSSQFDMWSTTQPALVQAAQAGRLPLILSWGPFGHPTFGSLIAKYAPCEATMAFPWLEIRKNEPYPVFTRATSDQRCPWLNAPGDFDAEGQINAYFRWKTIREDSQGLTMQLWLAHPAISKPLNMPKESTAHVTLRRLQQLKVRDVQIPGSYQWQWSRGGRVVQSGRVTPDPITHLLTVPSLTITTEPGELHITLERPSQSF